jgi:hypothetical protein
VLTVESNKVSCRVYEVHDDRVVNKVVSVAVASLVKVNPGHSITQHSTAASTAQQTAQHNTTATSKSQVSTVGTARRWVSFKAVWRHSPVRLVEADPGRSSTQQQPLLTRPGHPQLNASLLTLTVS